MQTDPNAQAFPSHPEARVPSGLTKREHFAALAMSGMCHYWGESSTDSEWPSEPLATEAVEQADALIAALNSTHSATGLPLCPTCGRLESQHTNPLAHKFGEPYLNAEPKP